MHKQEKESIICVRVGYRNPFLGMRGSKNFRQGGGGPGQPDKNSTDVFFPFVLVLSLFYRSQISISKKSIIFQGARGGSKFSRGGGGPNFPGRGGPIAYFL